VSNVPSSWPIVSLYDFCNPKQWPTIPQTAFVEKGYPVYGANGKIGYYTEFNHEQPTVLITCRGATCGTINVCKPKSYVTGNAMALDGLDESRVSPKYLVYALRNGSLAQAITGTAQPQITRQSLTAISIPLPPLAEQRRIAEVLDRAEALRAKRRAALAQFDSLTQSFFLDLFGDPFANRESTVRLGEVAEVLMGQSPPGSSYNTNSSGTPLLNGPTEFGERYPIEKQWTSEPTRLCQEGDILFCVRGATAGRLNRADKKYCLGRGLAAIRPRKGMAANTDFLFAVLDRYYDYFQAKGVGSTFININRDELQALPIPKAQQDKADALARQLTAVEKLKTAQRASLAELDALFATLQHRAFRGEL